jgi:hypothetical protein
MGSGIGAIATITGACRTEMVQFSSHACGSVAVQSVKNENIISTTSMYAAQVIISKQQDTSITAAVVMITINQNTNKN